MEIDEGPPTPLSSFSEAWLRGERDPQHGVNDSRRQLDEIGERIDGVTILPGGRAADVDSHFGETFLPSDLIRTQLRLARHYIESATDGITPALSSFVVLRVAIECMATALWLTTGQSQRVRVERFLKRMWWDTQDTVNMADVADADPNREILYELEETIYDVCEPIKGLDPERVLSSERPSLSSIVRDSSHLVRPEYPTLMQSTWMACAGVSHGNVQMSAGLGIESHSIRTPSEHPISIRFYAGFLEIVVADLNTAVEFFQRYAAEEHKHQRPSI